MPVLSLGALHFSPNWSEGLKEKSSFNKYLSSSPSNSILKYQFCRNYRIGHLMKGVAKLTSTPNYSITYTVELFIVK
jgi:hypothetical protein